MKQWIVVFAVMGLVFIGACFGVAESTQDEARWVNLMYEDYLAEPEAYTSYDATVTGHFSRLDSLFTGWHYFTVVTVPLDGREQKVSLSRDMKQDKTGSTIRVALPNGYDYSINNRQTATNLPGLEATAMRSVSA